MSWSAVAEQIARPVILMLLGALVAVLIRHPKAGHFIAACVAAHALAALTQHDCAPRFVRVYVPRASRVPSHPSGLQCWLECYCSTARRPYA